MSNRRFLVSFVFIMVAVISATAVCAQTQRIDLNSEMITGETDAGPEIEELVDEPWCFSSSICDTSWENWAPGVQYPLSAVLDLGEVHFIDAIHLFDHGGSGEFIVSIGKPGSWETLIEDPMDGWGWKSFTELSLQTRFLRFTRTTHGKVAEVVLFGEARPATKLEPLSVEASHRPALARVLADDDLGPHWETEWIYPETAWVKYTFDSSIHVDSIRTFSNSANFSGRVSIEVSNDGENFIPVAEDLDWNAWGWHEEGVGGQGRWVRIRYDNTASQGKLGGQNEIEVWGWTGDNQPEPTRIRTRYNAVLLHYNPQLGSAQDFATVDEYYGMRDVPALVDDYITALYRASGGQVEWAVADQWVLNEFPPSANPNVIHTPANFVDHVANNIGYGTGRVDYAAILNDPRFGIVDLVEEGQVDAVWVMPPPNCGFWETAMAGDGAYYVNGGPISGVSSNRRFVVYGFGHSAHQHVGFMLENTGHMVENIFVHHQNDWPKRHQVEVWNTLDLTDPNRALVWTPRTDPERWMLADGKNYISHWADPDAFLVSPGGANLGTVHYPPNALYNYGWGSLTEFFSNDDRWRLFGGTGVIVGGRYQLSGRAVLYDGNTPQPSRNFSLDVTLETDGAAGVLFRLSGYGSDPATGRGYYAGIDVAGDRLFIVRIDGGSEELASMPMAVDPGREYSIRVEADGPELRLYVSNLEDPDLEVSDATFSTGAFGLNADAESQALFDTLHIDSWADSGALAWHGYPDLSLPPRRVNSNNWGGRHDQWLFWWFEHLPKNPGTHTTTDIVTGETIDGLLNSWWPYLFDLNGFGEISGHDQGSLIFPEPDREKPDNPLDLESQEIADNAVAIYWREPSDNIGVTRYDVRRDGVFVQEQYARIYIDRNTSPGEHHRYEILARDGSGNVSQPAGIDVSKGFYFGVVNGDFEIGDGDIPWFWDTEAFRPADVRFSWEPSGSGQDGSRTIRIENTGANDSRWNQRVEGLTPGLRYRYSGWVKGEGIMVERTVGANLSVMLDGSWNQINAGSGSFDWKQVSVEFTAPPSGTITVQARLGHFGNLASGSATFDNLVLELVP